MKVFREHDSIIREYYADEIYSSIKGGTNRLKPADIEINLLRSLPSDSWEAIDTAPEGIARGIALMEVLRGLEVSSPKTEQAIWESYSSNSENIGTSGGDLEDTVVNLTAAEIEALTRIQNDAQSLMHDNLLQQAAIMQRFDGPGSWRSRWMIIGDSFVILRPKTEAEIHQASVELASLAKEVRALLPDFQTKFGDYINASMRMFSHSSLKKGVIGMKAITERNDETERSMKAGAQYLIGHAQSYSNLHDLSQEFASAKHEIVATLLDMSVKYRNASTLLKMVKNVTAQIPNLDGPVN